MLKSRQFRQLRRTAIFLFMLPALSAAVDSQPAAAQTASQVGQWSGIINTPLVPIHMVVGPNGKVLLWQRTKLAPSGPRSVLWTPSGDTFNYANVPAVNTDIFCAGHDLAPSGRVLLAGGHVNTTAGDGSKDLNVYDFNTNSWTQYPNLMNDGRWYPSLAYNGNGEGVIFSGTVTDAKPNPIPQVWGTNSSASLRSLTGASTSALDTQPYNWMYLAPSGRMFIAGPFRTSRNLDTAGSGSWSNGPSSLQNRFYGSVAFYNVGKVMIVGGSNEAYGTPSATAEVIDLNAATPRWIPTNPMANRRRHHTATILADGNVLVAGGTSLGSFNDPNGRVLAAEMWNQSTGQWSTMASSQVTRTYHGSAVLLNDGRVAFCGGGLPLGAGTGEDRTQGNYNCEIFSPPYLFKGTRPTISSAPAAINYNTNFTISTSDPNAIDRVSWVRLSSMTHGYNVGQRFANLSFTKTSTGLSIVAPKNKNNVPPGFYQLFVLNSQGVPSAAKIVKIS